MSSMVSFADKICMLLAKVSTYLTIVGRCVFASSTILMAVLVTAGPTTVIKVLILDTMVANDPKIGNTGGIMFFPFLYDLSSDESSSSITFFSISASERLGSNDL